MSKIKSVVAAALTLAVVGTAANAAPFTTTAGNVRLTITPLGAASNTTTTLSGYSAYLISVATTDASQITDLAFAGSGSAKETGFTGPLLQEALYDPNADAESSTPNELETKGVQGKVFGLDSHFLINNLAMQTLIISPTEDNDAITLFNSTDTVTTTAPGAPAPANPPTNAYGTGTSLGAQVGLQGAQEVSAMDVAYLVVPNAGSVAYDFRIYDTNNSGNGDPAAQFDGVIPTAVATPEPASLGILALGGVALLSRRNKTSRM